MEFALTAANPAYDEIREQGWAFIQVSPVAEWKGGAPYVDESYEPTDPEMTRIIWW